MQYKDQLAARTQRYHRASSVALQENYCVAKGIACLNAKDAWWHYGGEWAIYSCAMLSAALVNISRIYPEKNPQAF